MRYCVRCVLPDTRPHLVIEEDGVCNACKTHGTRPEIDWGRREKAFARLAGLVRKDGPGYDCLIPVSGGKDSHWQVLKCLEYGLKPLAVTVGIPGRTELGARNLQNLINLGVDHIDYRISPAVEKKFILAAFKRFGSTAVPFHLGMFNIPLNLAVQLKIPLVVWGENSAFEYGAEDEAHQGFRLDGEWLRVYGVTHGTTARSWVSEDLTEKDLTPYFGPTDQALDEAGVNAVFLGWYFPWDPETTLSAARAHGFEERREGPKTGLYDYADIDDDFISIHHWMKWYKFGFSRLFDNLSLEIRNGRLTRDEALRIVAESGDQTPWQDLEKLCSFLEISVDDFLEMAEAFRNHDIWEKQGGVWRIRDFIIPDWRWE